MTEVRPIPILEEHASVHTTVEEAGAVRVRIERVQSVRDLDLATRRDELQVQRIAVDRPVQERRSPWLEGDTWVVPVYEEVVVLQRQWVLKEEIRLVRQQTTATRMQSVPLWRERAVVERRQPDGSWSELPECAERDDEKTAGGSPGSPSPER